jgi:Zn-dependent M28 family amino/carboxypeptidase
MDTSAYLHQVVTVLARDFGFRSYRDAERLEKVADFISDQFGSFGYQVTRQVFLFRGKTYYNIIAELAGKSFPEKILVVGAHYDSVQTTPGADDNASGVAGVLALARVLAGKPLNKTVRFVAFALEEMPTYRTSKMGSYQYAQSLHEKGEQIEGMICLEMIGYFSDRDGSQHYPVPFFKLRYPTTGNFIAIVGTMKSKKFTARVSGDFQKGTDLPVVSMSAPPIVIGIDFSDHWSFGKFGYPACMVTDTAFYRNLNYHGPTDVPETLDYERMAKVVDGLTVAIEEWGRGEK